ncbi:MAG: prepilin-type N-terminal cleavage/methylation domain-containing protein [Armatimonadetes bacterium]|nr:prepilin-type N-terminal cleavage/methylation domain-containing protein [Armatimonadota bacterium]
MNIRTRSAFTLIELLVVIAIIAILAAILFPVFAQAKVAAKKVVVISGFKQTMNAHFLYAGDNDDTPCPQWRAGYGASGGGGDQTEGMSWDKLIQPYTKNFNILYSTEDKFPTYETPFGKLRRSFAVARNVFTAIQPRKGVRIGTTTYSLDPQLYRGAKSFTSVPLPAETIAMGEQRQDISVGNYPDPWTKPEWVLASSIENTRRSDWKNTGDPRAKYGNIDNPYAEGSVWGFVDGHARFQKVNGAASDGVFQGTLFKGYEQKAGAWVGGSGDPFWDRGISCLDALPRATDAVCKLPGE